MRHPHSKLSALALALVLAACGASDAIKSFRVALASPRPLVNSLVSSGAIKESQATAIIADFDAGAACAQTMQSTFDASKDLQGRERTTARLNASVGALRCWRAVIGHRNFASHPRIQQAADIAEGILASLVVFYSDEGPMRASAEGVATVKTAPDEKELERRLKQQVDLLKDAMKAN